MDGALRKQCTRAIHGAGDHWGESFSGSGCSGEIIPHIATPEAAETENKLLVKFLGLSGSFFLSHGPLESPPFTYGGSSIVVEITTASDSSPWNLLSRYATG